MPRLAPTLWQHKIEALLDGLPHAVTSFAEQPSHHQAGGDLTSQEGSLLGSQHHVAPVHMDQPPEATAASTKASTDPAKEIEGLGGGVVHVDLLNNNNSQYYADFMVGKPLQHFTAVFDTGSGITWVPGSKCHSSTCEMHNRFSKHLSGSHEEPSADAGEADHGAIHYGTGEVKYEMGTDTLTFCDSAKDAGCHGAPPTGGKPPRRLEVPLQPLGMATSQTSHPFSILPFDGILGLAPSGSKGSVLHQIKAAKSLPRNLIGVYLSEDTHRSGSMSFGGVEPAHIAKGAPLHWHRISNNSEWSVQMKDILVNGKPLHVCDARPGGLCPAVMDTGSSLITGPQDEIEKLLPQIHTDEKCGNLKEMPEISVQLVDKSGKLVSYPLTPEEYTLRSWEEVPGSGDTGYDGEFPVLGQNATAPQITPHCEPGIGVMDVPGRKWVLGDTLLRRYYSIYDDDRGLVGLVRSVHPDESAIPHQGRGPKAHHKHHVSTAMAPAWCVAPRCPSSASRCRRRPRGWMTFL
mmetsp:Transcript_54162/g.100034  ORF Transcript_54162/g.100034 Transcript_54162/m.100034 type:complete len:518 (-) Transcript_54162:74-1627(-)